MRIIFDPVPEPSHALNRADLKALFAVVPAEWLRYIKTAHLSSTLPQHSCFMRPVTYSAVGGRLNICSRGLDPNAARREVLRELAVRGLGMNSRKSHNLSAQELKRVDAVVTPLLDKIRVEPASEAD